MKNYIGNFEVFTEWISVDPISKTIQINMYNYTKPTNTIVYLAIKQVVPFKDYDRCLADAAQTYHQIITCGQILYPIKVTVNNCIILSKYLEGGSMPYKSLPKSTGVHVAFTESEVVNWFYKTSDCSSHTFTYTVNYYSYIDGSISSIYCCSIAYNALMM